MKVLHVIPSVGPLRGGPSMWIQTVARSLSRAGLEVHVATTDDNGVGRLRVPHGIPVIKEGVTYWYFSRQTRFYTFSWPLRQWLAQHVRGYDLVHTHALFSYATIPAALWAGRYGVPYIVRPLGTLNRWGLRNRHPWLKKLSFHLIERHILANAAVIHYTSEQELLEAAELGIAQRSIVIPNAVDMAVMPSGNSADQFRASYPQLAGRTIILFLARLDPKKGLDILLPAFARVLAQYPRVSLVLAGNGDPPFIAHLQHEAARLGIGRDIVWTGFLAGAEKWTALADADLFVLPSYSENFGVAVVEAMACGLPVVVSDQVGIHREVAEAQAGLVVPCDVEEFARAVLQLVGDARLHSQMSMNGRYLVRRQFSIEAITSKLVNTYAEVISPLSKLANV